MIGAVIIVLIYATRWPLLRALRAADVSSLLWFAPRGLITVVLLLGLPAALSIEHFPGGAVMLVVLAGAALLSVGARAGAPEASPSPLDVTVSIQDPVEP